MTLPNSPLPISATSTKSRSNRLCRANADEDGGSKPPSLNLPLVLLPRFRRAVVGEFSVAKELFEDPDAERAGDGFTRFFDGEY